MTVIYMVRTCDTTNSMLPNVLVGFIATTLSSGAVVALLENDVTPYVIVAWLLQFIVWVGWVGWKIYRG